MLMLPRIPVWWVCVLALIKIGAIASPSATSLTTKDIQYRCKAANVKVVITYDTIQSKFQPIYENFKNIKFLLHGNTSPSNIPWHPLSSFSQFPHYTSTTTPTTFLRDPMLLYFTSGTTGYPKMVIHHQSYAIALRRTASVWQRVTPEDVIYCVTDTGWAKAAFSTIFGQWHIGCCVFAYNHQRFEPSHLLQLLDNYPITVFCAPPTAYRKLILEDFTSYKFTSLRHCISAGEPLNPEVNRKWKQLTNHSIYEGYGQTETTIIICAIKEDVLKPGSMGKPLPFLEISVLDDNLKQCDVGCEGNIAIKVKPHHPIECFEGYYGEGSEEKNKQVFRGDWYITGDRAYVDSDGYFWFVSRNDDVIKTSGYRIGPFEVESALLTHPLVAEAAVVGVPHDTRGQVVKAFVVLKDDLNVTNEQQNNQKNDVIKKQENNHHHIIESFKVHCVKELTHYQRPSVFEIVSHLPKTVSGKIRRNELREREVQLYQKSRL